MKLTIWTFLSTALHLVLARFSILPVVALPPFMAAIPLIPVLAYTLVVSAFSYISVRIFKRFKLASHLFGFFRPNGRFSLFGVDPFEHELLPTSTPSRLQNAPVGVYAGSSNVSILRSSSVNISPGSPLLISPATSPPPNAPFRRGTNHSLTSFPLLEPTCRTPRRSRSLSVLVSRSHDRSSQLSPSPPPQQRILDDNAPSKDWIPLAPLSRNIPSNSGNWSSRDALAPAPVLHVSLSAPVTPRHHPDLLGPLIDISPISPPSSDPHDSPLAIMSSSSSELAPPSYSSESDRPSPLTVSLSRSSDIGVQRIGGAAGFAYDWGFETTFRTALHDNEKGDVDGLPEEQSIFDDNFDIAADASHIYCHEIIRAADQDFGGVGREKGQQVTEAVFIGKLQKEYDAEPELDGNHTLSKSLEMAKNAPEGTTDPATFEEDIVTEIVVCDSDTEYMPTKVWQDNWIGNEEPLSSPPLPVDKVLMGERPTVSIDTTQPQNVYKEDALLSAKKSVCPTPLQTPTPPASPPMTIVRFTIPTVPEPILSAESGEVDSEEIIQEEDGASNLSDNQESRPDSTTGYEMKDADVEQLDNAPITPESSEACSPSSVRPAWSARAVDASPLGLSVARAAMVEEEVTWPKATEKTDVARELRLEESVGMKVTEVSAAQQAVTPMEDSSTESAQGTCGILVQAPVPKSTSSLPGSFPGEPESVQNDLQVVPTTSMAVARAVAGSGMGRRRRNLMQGLPIDVALAMQLRPGFGVGADPAWMVRFLMAVFGWFTVMIAGRGGDVDVYAL